MVDYSTILSEAYDFLGIKQALEDQAAKQGKPGMAPKQGKGQATNRPQVPGAPTMAQKANPMQPGGGATPLAGKAGSISPGGTPANVSKQAAQDAPNPPGFPADPYNMTAPTIPSIVPPALIQADSGGGGGSIGTSDSTSIGNLAGKKEGSTGLSGGTTAGDSSDIASIINKLLKIGKLGSKLTSDDTDKSIPGEGEANNVPIETQVKNYLEGTNTSIQPISETNPASLGVPGLDIADSKLLTMGQQPQLQNASFNMEGLSSPTTDNKFGLDTSFGGNQISSSPSSPTASFNLGGSDTLRSSPLTNIEGSTAAAMPGEAGQSAATGTFDLSSLADTVGSKVSSTAGQIGDKIANIPSKIGSMIENLGTTQGAISAGSSLLGPISGIVAQALGVKDPSEMQLVGQMAGMAGKITPALAQYISSLGEGAYGVGMGAATNAMNAGDIGAAMDAATAATPAMGTFGAMMPGIGGLAAVVVNAIMGHQADVKQDQAAKEMGKGWGGNLENAFMGNPIAAARAGDDKDAIELMALNDTDPNFRTNIQALNGNNEAIRNYYRNAIASPSMGYPTGLGDVEANIQGMLPLGLGGTWNTGASSNPIVKQLVDYMANTGNIPTLNQVQGLEGAETGYSNPFEPYKTAVGDPNSDNTSGYYENVTPTLDYLLQSHNIYHPYQMSNSDNGMNTPAWTEFTPAQLVAGGMPTVENPDPLNLMSQGYRWNPYLNYWTAMKQATASSGESDSSGGTGGDGGGEGGAG